MARLSFLAVALLALVFAGSSTYTGRTQQAVYPAVPHAADESRVIYSLTDMGLDAPLGFWIRENVLEIIEPDSWKGRGGNGMIRYYEPKNILLVKQTSAIQKKVDCFLKELKASMPKASVTSFASRKTPHAGVVPADYREPALIHASTPASEPSSYPVPAAVKPTKHLFHFIIRYEGDGIIDDNVVKFMKTQLQGAKSPISMAPAGAAYIPGAPPAPAVGSVMPPQPGYAVPPAVAPYGGYGGSAAPTLPDGSPAPSAGPVPAYSSPAPSPAPIPPTTAPKKKKEKKGDQKKTTVTS